jgi:hypothetical protein
MDSDGLPSDMPFKFDILIIAELSVSYGWLAGDHVQADGCIPGSDLKPNLW